MPLQVDNNQLTEITVDASGHETVDANLNNLDPSGRIVTKERLEELQKPQEALPTEQEVVKQEDAKKSEAEARKLYLAAQKAERRAKEMEKKAAESLKKAEAFEAAKELAESGKDPTAILKAAGLDPIKFYRDMTTQALKGEETPEDPVQKEIRLLKEQNDKYAKDLEVVVKTAQEKEEVIAHNQVITTKVIPLLTQNPERFEALLAEYGNNAAVQVYTQVWEHYQKTGEMVPFEQAADALEKFWSDQIESGLTAASKLKKFANRFAQAQQTQEKQSVEQEETPRRSNFTLSNKQTISSSPTKNTEYNRYLNRDDRAAQILKKYGE